MFCCIFYGQKACKTGSKTKGRKTSLTQTVVGFELYVVWRRWFLPQFSPSDGKQQSRLGRAGQQRCVGCCLFWKPLCVSLRLVSQSWLWILTNSCRNVHSPCWGWQQKSQTKVLRSKQFLMPRILLKAQAARKVGQFLKKKRKSHWKQWKFGTKHLWVAEHQLIFFPDKTCEVFTLFSFLKQWNFDIFPITLDLSKRYRLFQVR